MLVAKSQFQRNTCQKCSIGPVQTQKAAYAEKIVISFRCSLVTANCIRILAIDGHISVNSSKFLIYSEYDWCSRYNPVNNSYHTEKCMHVCCVARRVHSNLTLAKYLFNGFFSLCLQFARFLVKIVHLTTFDGIWISMCNCKSPNIFSL